MFVICTVVQFYSDSLLQVVDDFTIATNFPRSIFDKGRPICINIFQYDLKLKPTSRYVQPI